MRKVLAALILAVVFAGSWVAGHARHHASTQASFFCVFSTSVNLAGHTLATPTICIPSPPPPPTN
jgi:uncharacterized membrane protein YsdA (DUF1294 family)